MNHCVTLVIVSLKNGSEDAVWSDSPNHHWRFCVLTDLMQLSNLPTLGFCTFRILLSSFRAAIHIGNRITKLAWLNLSEWFHIMYQ